MRNQVLPLNSHKRVPGGRERRCANRSRSIEWSASGLHRTRPAERRAVFPIRQRNCLWPSLAPRPPSARFLSRFRVRARLVEDRKIHCALLRRRSAAQLPRLRLLPRAARVSPAFDLWSQPVEDVPRSVYPYHPPIVKFWTDGGVALAVSFISGKSADMWTRRAPVQNILAVLDLDILLPGFDNRPIRVSPCQAVV